MKTNIILIQPPVRDFYDTDIRLQPVGLCSIKAAAQEYLAGDVRITVKDYHHGWGRRTVPIPEEMSYLADYYVPGDKSPFCAFGPYYHFGASFEQLAEEVVSEKPDLIGVSSLFSPYYREVLACCAEIKKRREVPILAGGHHPTAMPEQMLESPDIDYVLRGEAERTFALFVAAWRSGRSLSGVPGLCFRRDGRIVVNARTEEERMTDLPVPDYSDLNPARYLYHRKPLCMIVTSRGCPYRCGFCSVHGVFGGKFRQRTASDVFEEIRRRYRDGYRVFDFEDDNLTLNRDFIIELCAKLSSEYRPGEIELLAMNGVCYWNLDREILAVMRGAGFTHLNLSLVSLDAALLQALQRPQDLSRYRFVVEEAFRLGFHIVSYQILGLPGESLESAIEAVVFQARLPVLLGASPYYRVPREDDTGLLSRDSREELVRARLSAMAGNSMRIGREDLYTLFVTARILNFLKGLNPDGNSVRLSDILEGTKKMDQRTRTGADLINRLFDERQLYAMTGHGLIKLRKFNFHLFESIWRRIGSLSGRAGGTILLACFLILGVGPFFAGDSRAEDDGEVVTQISVLPALMAGIYDGDSTVGDLKKQGDFGIGTFNGLDGEMIISGGKFYRADADGKLEVAGEARRVPFATVVRFNPTGVVPVGEISDFSGLIRFADGILGSANYLYAIEISGQFRSVTVRSIPGQQRPYAKMKEVIAGQQRKKTYERISGKLIGFRVPRFMSGTNVAGYHFHFLSDTGLVGGHVLELGLDAGTVRFERFRQLRLRLPGDSDFGDAALDEADEDEVTQIERMGRQSGRG
jgi:alpha-acetolactate decarboxylase